MDELLSSDYSQIVMGLVILTGLVNTFFGYRLFKFVMVLWAFLIGGSLGASLAVMVVPGSSIAALIGGIIAGVICAAVVVPVYILCVVLVGALFGGIVGTTLTVAAGSGVQIAAGVGGAVLCAILAVYLQKVVIIIATAFAGSMNVVCGFCFFTLDVDPAKLVQDPDVLGDKFTAVIIAWIALGFAGAATQFGLTKRYKHKPKQRKRPQKSDDSEAAD